MAFRYSRLMGIFVAAMALNLSGCATFEYTKPAPAQKEMITVKPSGEEFSGWTDLPIGVYRIPDSHVIIAGHQRGVGPSMLFGLVGLAIAHSVNASAGEQAVKNAEEILRMKLDDQVSSALASVVADSRYSKQITQGDAAGNSKLLITPGLVLSYVSDTHVRPFVILKASMQGADKNASWTTRYIASSGESRALAGANGWLENNGEQLKATVKKNIDIALQTMMADVTKPYPRDDNALIMVQANFPYVKDRIQTNGYMLSEDDNYLTFIPKLGDVITFAGVNIFDKKMITHRLATKDDPFLKLVPAEPTAEEIKAAAEMTVAKQ